MDMSRLSAEEKRLRDWQHFVQTEEIDDDVKQEFRETLKAFRNLLAKIWEQESVSEDDVNNLGDMRRRLTQLMEEARLHAR